VVHLVAVLTPLLCAETLLLLLHVEQVVFSFLDQDFVKKH